MYKNWSAICAIKKPHLRIFVASARDPRVIEKLAARHPSLFIAQKPERDGPWPLSAIRCVVGDHMASVTDLVHAHVIIREVFGLSCQLGTYRGDEVEEGILRLSKSEAAAIWDAPRLATQFTDLFPIGLVKTTIDDVEYYVGYIGEIYVQLYACALINERA